MDPDEPFNVYSTNDPNQAELIKAELRSEGIACEVTGENQGGLAGILEVTVVVRAKDADRARKLIKQHEEKNAQ